VLPKVLTTALSNLLSRGPRGYEIDEVMTGVHEFEPGVGLPGKRFMEFTATWGAVDLPRVFDPRSDDFLVHSLHGRVTVEGLCEDTPCHGKLELRYFHDQTIRYTFEFAAAGVAYRYVGEKVHIWPWNLPWSHTTCFGRLVRVSDGKLVSTSVTHFRLSSAPRFLASFRLI